MKTLQQLAILVFLGIQCISYGQENKLDIIKQKFDPLLTEQNKGVAVLIKKDKEIKTLSLGSFNLNENNVFNIGSATKTFTAILFLQEMEKGNIHLTDSIGTYLTPIKNVPQCLTIEALLTHESGLDEIIGRNIETIFYAKNDSLYNDNLLNQVEKNDPKMIDKYDYCNTNYFLLGRIIEKVTDQSYFDLVRERIITPLKMENTYPYVHKNLPNLATPFHQEKDVTDYLDYKYYANIAYAAGSIASTLSDMEIFYTSLFETEILLKKETVKQMIESGNDSYGLGLMKSSYDGKKLVGHGGNNIGYSFRNNYDPETKNLYLMFNNTHRMPLNESLKNDLLAYLDNKEIEKFNNVNIDNFKKFVGKYLLKEANLIFEIAQENGKLFLIAEAQGIKSKLTQKNSTTLYDTTVGATLEVVDGNENALTFSQNGFTTIINKVITKS
ncbi:serine hydrolase domain-containing protein [Polaribacter sp. Hel1_85]|uniref:serine hydrolase domain-containing protein n=1 Tax=Polaribacter sp. Hel1_85 TaxID=1250005 RepID=UPI00052CCE56|nr:serine hydrolase domain-containing protein [Polaribacter sp. Hel1_85]KGL63460.1 beta-lactamase [Polaribacter sp. Hel1_85]